MRKNSKKKGNKEHKKTKNQTVVIQINASELENFDYDKFTESMINAQIKVKEIEAEAEREKEKKDRQEWHEIIGYKECKDDVSPVVKLFYYLYNYLSVFFHIIFLRKRYAKYGIATNVLVQSLLHCILGTIKVVLYIAAFLFIILLFYPLIEISFIECVILAIFFLTFASIVRIAQYEIGQIKEQEYLIAILSMLISFIALIIAILAFFVK